MKMPKTVVFTIADMACFKWSCILFGMGAGAFWPDFTRRHIRLFAAAAILLALKPIVVFFRAWRGAGRAA